ncbi:MAG: GntR family transcriptional regulator [Paracoccaceae bacterium]
MPPRPVLTPGTPLYAQIRTVLRDRIAGGELRPGATLPSELRLATELGVSTGTIRKAVDALVADGTLIRHQGRGTFVAEETPERAAYRFFRVIAPDGRRLVPEPVSERVTRTERAEAEAVVPQAGGPLGLDRDERVILIERVRALLGTPALFEISVLAETRFAALDAPPLPNALYPHYQARCGVSVHEAEDRLAAAPADQRTASALGLAEGTPVLRIDRIARDLEGRAVERRRSWLAPGPWSYAVDLP